MAETTEKPRDGFITIATVRDRSKARQLASKLAAAKIESVVRDARESSHPGGRWFPAGEVKVQVNRGEVRAALDVLRSAGAAAGDAESGERPGAGEMRRVSLEGGDWKKTALEVAALVGAAALLGIFVFS